MASRLDRLPALNRTDAEAIEAFAARARAQLGPRLVDLRLFGSKARGDATAESDIDILVVVSVPRDEELKLQREASDIAFDVNLEHDVFISPCVLSEEHVRDPVWGRTPFLKTVRRESVAL
jgi:predicted nucleotidyltransferase